MKPTNELHALHGKGLIRLLAILMVALNLRGAITCVGPLLKDIQAHFGLNGTAAGLLTSLPLFAFGFLSPYAAPLARRLGMEQAVFLAMLLLLAGMGVRYMDGTAWLYLGTALIGCGIAFNNVLLPGLLRRDFPAQLALVTALFTMVMVTCGGLGSGIAIPLADMGDWRLSLLSWVIPAVVALALWLPQLKGHSEPSRATPHSSLWNRALAWQVSLFMACQATAFYVMIAWFPSMMRDLIGISAARSGVILFIYQIFVLASVMVTPVLIHRMKDQRIIAVVLSGLILAGYLGLYFDPGHALAWMIVMGSGSGGALVLSITLFSLRVETAGQSVALSGMAQAVGYSVAAVTPILIGYIHDQTHQWTAALLLMICLALVQLVVGLLAGRPLKIRAI
ncbi:MAG: MFS transporter [Proteobacteria bacterium]|jgi:CP family cyanate transporter-like MFS transporter|nr:MFS transporter [Pseudomonadota bacterium]